MNIYHFRIGNHIVNRMYFQFSQRARVAIKDYLIYWYISLHTIRWFQSPSFKKTQSTRSSKSTKVSNGNRISWLVHSQGCYELCIIITQLHPVYCLRECLNKSIVHTGDLHFLLTSWSGIHQMYVRKKNHSFGITLYG